MRAIAARFLVPGLVLISCAHARAENWPHWRGPTYDGISTESGVPIRWSAEENVAWKLPLPGPAGSTPVVWGKRIFLTSQDQDDIVLLAVSTDGKELWKRKLGTTSHGVGRVRSGEGNNPVSPSPSTDGKYVYVFDGGGDFVAFDYDGKEIWRFNAQDRYGNFKIQFGMHTTPLLFRDRLYLALLHSGGHWVIAIDKDTGKDVWKVARPSDGVDENEHSYASPCLWRKGQEAYLVVHGNDYATAHRLDDGQEIWRLGDLNPKSHYNHYLRFVTSPVAVSDLIVVPSAKNGPVVGVKPEAKGLIMAGNAFEQWRRPRDTPDVPCPLVHDGLVYLCKENGVLICVDAQTGKEYYNKRIVNDRYRASPVYADGKVYLMGRGCKVTVVKAGPQFEQLALNSLPDTVTASLVISNGRIYVRGFEALYAIGSTRTSRSR